MRSDEEGKTFSPAKSFLGGKRETWVTDHGGNYTRDRVRGVEPPVRDESHALPHTAQKSMWLSEAPRDQWITADDEGAE